MIIKQACEKIHGVSTNTVFLKELVCFHDLLLKANFHPDMGPWMVNLCFQCSFQVFGILNWFRIGQKIMPFLGLISGLPLYRTVEASMAFNMANNMALANAIGAFKGVGVSRAFFDQN